MLRLSTAILLAFTLALGCEESSGAQSPDGGQLVPAPVGTPTGAAVERTIGPAGGKLVSADDVLEVDIPAGALAAETRLSIQPIVATAPGAASGAFRLTKPADVTFAQPVGIKFRLAAADIGGAATEFLGVAYQTPNGLWERQPSAFDASTRVVSTQTTHFSDWSSVSGFQLRPGTASVKVNDKLQLAVRSCPASTEAAAAELCPITQPCYIYECRETSVGAALSDWSVNGKVGGDSTTGTVTATEEVGTFTAPSKVPNPDVVAVSVRGRGFGPGGFLMVANITITDVAQYTGTVNYSGLQGGLYTGTASLSFRQIEDLPDVTRFELAGGQFTTTVNWPDCDPVSNVILSVGSGESEGGLVISKENNSKTYFWDAGSQTKDVMMSCGTPRQATPMTVVVTLPSVEGTYEDRKTLAGSASGLPLGGTVDWMFTTE